MAMSNMLAFLSGWVALFGNVALAYTVLGAIIVGVVAAGFLGYTAYKRHRGRSTKEFGVEDETSKKATKEKEGFLARRREKKAAKELTKAKDEDTEVVEVKDLTPEEKARVSAIEGKKEENDDVIGEEVLEETEELLVEEKATKEENKVDQKQTNKDFGGKVLGE